MSNMKLRRRSFSKVMKRLQGWLQQPEVQALLLGTAFVIFIYIITSWVLYSIFCVIWPLTILGMLVMVMFPNTAGSFIIDALPPSLGIVTQWLLTLIYAGNLILQPAAVKHPQVIDHLEPQS